MSRGGGRGDGPPSVLVLTDTDSYVKWGAALADLMPPAWRRSLVIARSTALPSDEQVADAVDGTSFAGSHPPVVGMADLRELLERDRPDVVVVAARGYTVQAAVSVIDNVADRPVIVTGLPGVGVPVLPYGLGFRRAADVFVVHSRRELREFEHAADRLGLDLRFELATLPYLHPGGGAGPRAADRSSVVFAAQALVPATRRERVWLVERLADTARARPDLTVVVKVRAARGEAQTHHEPVPYEELVEELEDRPGNLVVESGPMQHHLDRAVGLVTVSSTALLEAVAAGVPALALEDFGVGVSQINLALRGSGLLGDTNDLVAQSYGHPVAAWLDDNYLHGESADTWIDRLEALLLRRAEDGLPPYPSMPGRWRDGFRSLLYRHFAFVDESDGGDRRGLVAGSERLVVASALWLTQRRARLLRWGPLRSVLPSPHGARAMEFARENSRTAPGPPETQAEPTPTPERVGPARTTAGL